MHVLGFTEGNDFQIYSLQAANGTVAARFHFPTARRSWLRLPVTTGFSVLSSSALSVSVWVSSGVSSLPHHQVYKQWR